MSLAELRYHVGVAVERFFFRVRFRGRELVDGSINRGQLRYAQDLVLQMARKHYSRLSEPDDQFAPFDDIGGCLSQIDNMLTGLQRKGRCAWCNGRCCLRPSELCKFKPVDVQLLALEREAAAGEVPILECPRCGGSGEVETVAPWDRDRL